MSSRPSPESMWSGVGIPDGVEVEALDGGIGVIPGLRAGAAAVGVRVSSHRDPAAPDLGIIDVGHAVPAAIVTTTNQVKAAPCLVGVEHVATGPIRAVVVNSGNANACTGAQGIADARAMASAVGDALGVPGTAVVPMSTGVIGVPLPLDRIVAGIPLIIEHLAEGPDATGTVARAMMTTDTRPKQSAVRLTLDATSVLVGGIAKGAGMIEPAMATMLSVLVTDALLGSDELGEVLIRVVERTFNRISVDSCGSTNDTVLLLATGTAGPVPTEVVAAGLELVAADLAHRIVEDGEGVTRIANLRVTGAPDVATARGLGRAVAASALFRTALHGSDPNWGRVLAAMGASEIAFDPSLVTVAFGPVVVCRDGGATPYDHEAAVAMLRGREVAIGIDLGLGDAAASTLVADLSAGYVQVNAEYTT